MEEFRSNKKGKKEDIKKIFDVLDPKLREDIMADVRQRKAEGMPREEILLRLKRMVKFGRYMSNMDPAFSDKFQSIPPDTEDEKLQNEIDQNLWEALGDIEGTIKEREKKPDPSDTIH